VSTAACCRLEPTGAVAELRLALELEVPDTVLQNAIHRTGATRRRPAGRRYLKPLGVVADAGGRDRLGVGRYYAI